MAEELGIEIYVGQQQKWAFREEAGKEVNFRSHVWAGISLVRFRLRCQEIWIWI